MKRLLGLLSISVIGLFLLSNCGKTTDVLNNVVEEPTILEVMTHDSFSVSSDLISIFELENNVTVKFLPSGDTGAALNRAILTKNSPQADVFYGVDNSFLSRALDEDIFEAYSSPQLDNISDQFKLDSGNHLLPVDYGDVCINYDKAFFKENMSKK